MTGIMCHGPQPHSCYGRTWNASVAECDLQIQPSEIRILFQLFSLPFMLIFPFLYFFIISFLFHLHNQQAASAEHLLHEKPDIRLFLTKGEARLGQGPNMKQLVINVCGCTCVSVHVCCCGTECGKEKEPTKNRKIIVQPSGKNFQLKNYVTRLQKCKKFCASISIHRE